MRKPLTLATVLASLLTASAYGQYAGYQPGSIQSAAQAPTGYGAANYGAAPGYGAVPNNGAPSSYGAATASYFGNGGYRSTVPAAASAALSPSSFYSPLASGSGYGGAPVSPYYSTPPASPAALSRSIATPQNYPAQSNYPAQQNNAPQVAQSRPTPRYFGRTQVPAANQRGAVNQAPQAPAANRYAAAPARYSQANYGTASNTPALQGAQIGLPSANWSSGPLAQSPGANPYGPAPATNLPPAEVVPAPPSSAPAWTGPNSAPALPGMNQPGVAPSLGMPGQPGNVPYTTNPPANPLYDPAAVGATPWNPGYAPASPDNVFADPGVYSQPAVGTAPDGGCDPCFDGCGPRWFGGAAGMLMTRDRPNARTIAFDNTNINSTLIDQRDAVNGQWRGGAEARIGRVIGCNWAIEAVYFWIDPFYYAPTVVSPTNSISTALDFQTGGPVTIGGQPADNFFDNAHVQQLARRDEIHNVEINLLSQAWNTPTMRWGVTGLTGVRFFRFQEGLTYHSAEAGTNFGDNGGTTAAKYSVGVTNNLIGWQLGARMHYYLCPNLRLYATPRMGVMANGINARSQLYRDDGVRGFDVHAYKVDCTLLGQLDVGASWQITPHWSLFMSYRALGISGIALADNQIPQFMADQGYMANVHTNGSLILHGMVSGVQFVY